MTGLVSLPDKSGTPRLVCAYTKIKPPLEAYEWSLAVWNEEQAVFREAEDGLDEVRRQPESAADTGRPSGFLEGRERAGNGCSSAIHSPHLRCPATFEAWQDEKSWEVLKPQPSLRGAGGESVKPHSGSIAWHPWRNRWVAVFMQSFGKPSAFGELWYAEADAPTGLWGTAVKVSSHDNYTFYNPRLHIEFTPAGSPSVVLRGHLHDAVRGQARAHAAIRLQPDPLPNRLG